MCTATASVSVRVAITTTTAHRNYFPRAAARGETSQTVYQPNLAPLRRHVLPSFSTPKHSYTYVNTQEWSVSKCSRDWVFAEVERALHRESVEMPLSWLKLSAKIQGHKNCTEKSQKVDAQNAA